MNWIRMHRSFATLRMTSKPYAANLRDSTLETVINLKMEVVEEKYGYQNFTLSNEPCKVLKIEGLLKVNNSL